MREPLVETAKPWNSPAAMFAVPIPIISWSGSTSSPRLAAKLAAVAIVSVSDTSVIPIAAISSGGMSLALVQGRLGAGTPRGSEPTVSTPWSERPRTADATVAPTTATSTAGSRRETRGITSSTANTASPTASVVAVRPVEAVEEGLHLGEERVRRGREPEQLRQLSDDDRDGQAVHVADLHLLGEEVGDEPELARARARSR